MPQHYSEADRAYADYIVNQLGNTGSLQDEAARSPFQRQFEQQQVIPEGPPLSPEEMQQMMMYKNLSPEEIDRIVNEQDLPMVPDNFSAVPPEPVPYVNDFGGEKAFEQSVRSEAADKALTSRFEEVKKQGQLADKILKQKKLGDEIKELMSESSTSLA